MDASRERLRGLLDALDEHEILNSASAIAFQTLFALVPLGLFTLALVGFLELDRAWDDAVGRARVAALRRRLRRHRQHRDER